MTPPAEEFAERVLLWCQREGCIFTDERRASLARLLASVARDQAEECRQAYEGHYFDARGAADDERDWCQKCGANFRDPIHFRRIGDKDETRESRIAAIRRQGEGK